MKYPKNCKLAKTSSPSIKLLNGFRDRIFLKKKEILKSIKTFQFFLIFLQSNTNPKCYGGLH
jgi:hypothetical protein